MDRLRARIVAGLILALALGAFGPVQRAVSMESRTYLELEGPIPALPWGTAIASLYLNSKRGAAASWTRHGSRTASEITFLAATGDNLTIDADTRHYRARAGGERIATLTVWTCGWSSGCKERTWIGADTFSHDPTFSLASFSGTLYDDDGAPCTVEAVWRSRSGPNVTYVHRDDWWVQGRTRQPAHLDLESSCLGSHRLRDPDEAEMWTDQFTRYGT